MHDTPPKATKYGMPCTFKGQGWSPVHLDQLSLSLILARASKLFRPKIHDDGFSIEIYINLIEKKGKFMLDWSFKHSLLQEQVGQLTFYIFVKLAITPYCP